MKFAQTRYYPVDQKHRIVYLDAQRTKAACSQFRGCVGIHGEELSLRWPDMQKSYTVQRKPEQRGGAGRGQGRKPLAVPVVTIKVRIFATAHQKLEHHIETLKARSGKYISAQQFLSDLVLKADLNQIVPYVKNERRGERAMAVIIQEAGDRLDELVVKVGAVKPDLFISRTKVLSAIIYQATRAAR